MERYFAESVSLKAHRGRTFTDRRTHQKEGTATFTSQCLLQITDFHESPSRHNEWNLLEFVPEGLRQTLPEARIDNLQLP